MVSRKAKEIKMNPKLLRHYSNILNEAAYQTGSQFMASRPPAAQPDAPGDGTFQNDPNVGAGAKAIGSALSGFFQGGSAGTSGRGGGGKPSAPLPSNPNAPAYTTGGKPAKIGTQNFNMAGGAGKPTATPAAPNYSSAVKSANAAFAANQAKAPQGDQTAGGKTNAAFLPGAAGGAAPAIASATATPPPQTNALGIAPQANITGSPTGSAAQPTPAPQANALGIAPQANTSSPFGTAPVSQSAKPSPGPVGLGSATVTPDMATAAKPASVNPPTQGGPQVTGSTNMSTDSDATIAKRGPMGITLPEAELEEDNELSELMRLSGRPSNKPKVSESVMLEAGSTLEHIIKKFKHETKNFLAGNDLDNDLYDALYDYYSDNGEMPYGVAKARDGDPYQWISNKFADEMQMHGYGRQTDMLNMPGHDHELTELARLAGLSESQVAECGDTDMEQNDSMNVSTNMNSDGTKSVSISAQGDRADALLQMLKMAGMRPHDDHDEGHEEVVVIGAPDEMMDEGSEDLHTPKLSPEQLASEVVKMLQAIPGEEDDGTFEDLNHFYSWVIESMDEDDASYYADIMDAMGEDELEQARHMVNNWLSKNSHGEEELDEYANSPEEEYETISAITRQGNDLNREKRQYADKPKLGDNPMAEDVALDEELQGLLDSILFREEMTDVLKAEQPYKDEKTGKMVTPPKGATMPPADSPPATKTAAPTVKK